MKDLPTPFFVLAPMDDVTDTVFRKIVHACSPADLYLTEFVNVDGLQSIGRPRLLPRVALIDEPYQVFAQIWGKNPENFYKTAKEIADGSMAKEANTLIAGNPGKYNFAGIDINFGCPDKTVVRNNTCSAFIKPENRSLALEIIAATKEGVAASGKDTPLSVKTRLGFSEVDLSWHETLLQQKLNMLTIHGRTRSEMSKVPAHWDKISEIVQLRNDIAPSTKIVGNGDVIDRAHGQKLAKETGVDGIMIGRGVFKDPYCFSSASPWEGMSREERISLLRRHAELFMSTWKNGERRYDPMKKFTKIYISDFPGANELREKLMKTTSPQELLKLL